MCVCAGGGAQDAAACRTRRAGGRPRRANCAARGPGGGDPAYPRPPPRRRGRWPPGPLWTGSGPSGCTRASSTASARAPGRGSEGPSESSSPAARPGGRRLAPRWRPVYGTGEAQSTRRLQHLRRRLLLLLLRLRHPPVPLPVPARREMPPPPALPAGATGAAHFCAGSSQGSKFSSLKNQEDMPQLAAPRRLLWGLLIGLISKFAWGISVTVILFWLC